MSPMSPLSHLDDFGHFGHIDVAIMVDVVQPEKEETCG